MKRKEIISGILSTSLLVSSCTHNDFYEELPSKKKISNLTDLGEAVLPIKIELGTEDALYIKAIQQVCQDILESPEKAKQFKKSPSKLLKEYGYQGEINLDDNILSLLDSLSDNDILRAIKNNDIKSFINLCAEKKIFNSEYKNTKLANIVNTESVQKLIESSKTKSSEREQVSPIVIAFIIAVVGAVVIAGIAIYVAIKSAIKSSTSYEAGGNNLNALDIYMLKSKEENTYVSVNQEIDNIVDESISFVKANKPNYFKSISEENVRSMIKINLIKQMNNE